MPTPVTLPESWARSRVSVVVPTFNEAANLPRLVEAVLALDLPELRLIVVDDGSPDGTGEVADKLAAEYGGQGTGRITVVHRTSKAGIGAAYVAGMERALGEGADFVAQMDADLSHPPDYLPQLLGTLLATNADVVVGSRYVPGGSLSAEWGRRRRLLSGWANAYLKAVLAIPVRDITAGFKLWRRETLRALDLSTVRSSGYSFQVETLFRAYSRGHKIVEIPIHFEERQEGTSKLDLAVHLESALRPFQLLRHERAARRGGG